MSATKLKVRGDFDFDRARHLFIGESAKNPTSQRRRRMSKPLPQRCCCLGTHLRPTFCATKRSNWHELQSFTTSQIKWMIWASASYALQLINIWRWRETSRIVGDNVLHHLHAATSLIRMITILIRLTQCENYHDSWAPNTRPVH